MPMHLDIRGCPICRADAKPLGIEVSYGLPCFEERVRIAFSRCPSCGFVFQANPLTRSDLALYYRASPRYRGSNESDAERDLYEDQLRTMADAGMRTGGAVLDIGADMGRLLDLIKARYQASTAYMEDSDFACAHINGHGRHWQVADLHNSGPFDWIVLSQVLEHIVDPVAFLQGLHDCLGEEGRLFVEVPCHGAWDDREVHFSFEHVNYFSPATLVAAVQTAGFLATRSEVRTHRRYSGGNLWFLRMVAERLPMSMSTEPGRIEAIKRHYDRAMGDRFRKISDLAQQYGSEGKIALYGAGELADLLINNSGIDTATVAAIFDTDTAKHGVLYHGLRVRSPKEAAMINPAAIVVLSAAEAAIRATLEEAGYGGRVICWSNL